jgi:hypothetical protein
MRLRGVGFAASIEGRFASASQSTFFGMVTWGCTSPIRLRNSAGVQGVSPPSTTRANQARSSETAARSCRAASALLSTKAKAASYWLDSISVHLATWNATRKWL